MNAKQFQDLLKQSKQIINEQEPIGKDEDWKPKDAPQIMRERVPQQAESNDQDIERLLDDMLEVATEIVDRIEECKSAVQDDDREYMEKELSDLESVVSGATSDLEGSMQDIMMALDSKKEPEEDEDGDEDER